MAQTELGDFPLVATIDLGSNSFHMVLARVDHGEIRILERLGEKVQLGAGLDEQGILNEEAINKDMVTATVELRVTPQRDCGFESIARTIMQYDEVESISLMAGAYDFSVTVKGANVKDVSLFVSQRLAPLGNVLSTATYFVLKKYKEMGKIVVDEEKDERGFYFP